MTAKKEILVPLSTEDVTFSWFEQILSIKIDEKSFSATGNANNGVGFLSNLVRVRFEEILLDGSKKEHCVVVKLLPPQECDQQLVISEKMDKSELHFYEKLIPEMVAEMPSLESYFCPMIYGKVQEENSEENIPYASVLVLRDLKRDGYILKPFSTTEMDSEEIVMAIDFLASFHAASAFIELKKKKPLSNVYDAFPEWYYPNERKDRQFTIHTWFIEGFKHTADVMNGYTANINPAAKDSMDEIIAKLVEPLAPYAQEIYNQVLRAGQLFPSIIHGDLWQNNLLISPNPHSIKIIDWQMVGYSDSVYDLAVLLGTSLFPDLSLENLEKHSKIYFDRLEQIYLEKEKLGTDISGIKRRSWEEFWQAMKTYGIAFVFIVFVMGCNTVSAFPENFPKLYEGLRFFHYEANLADFLTKAIKS